MIQKIIDWAKKEKSIRALVLTGSRAKDKNVDAFSDYDISVFATNSDAFTRDLGWLGKMGKVWVSIPEKITLKKKVYPTRLVIFEKGIKADFAFFTVDLLKEYVKSKSLPEDFNRGYKIILSKDGIAEKLQQPAFKGFKNKIPSEKEYLALVEEFWFEVYHVAKYLKREDLWVAKARDADIKHRLLLKMIEWHAAAKQQLDYTPNSMGKRMESWVEPKIWKAMQGIFAHFDSKDSWKCLIHSLDLFRQLSLETAHLWNFTYPYQIDKAMTQYITKLTSR